MGVTCHHAIVVTSNCDEDLELAHAKAKQIFPWVSEISPAQANGYRSFLCPPDGGKEGNTFSKNGDGRRHDFIEWLKEAPGQESDGKLCLSWCEVAFGADLPEQGDRLLRTNGVDRRLVPDLERLRPEGDLRDYVCCPECGYHFVVVTWEAKGDFEGSVQVAGYEEGYGVYCPACDEEGRETAFVRLASGWVKADTVFPLGPRSRLASVGE